MFVKSFRRDVYFIETIEYLKIVGNFIITMEIFTETRIYCNHHVNYSFVV